MVIFDDDPHVINFQNIDIPVRAVLQRLGYPQGRRRDNSEVNRIFDEEIERAPKLFKSQGVFRFLEVASKDEELITFKKSSFLIKSKQVVKMLNGSDLVIVFMVTIGPLLEQEVDKLMNQGEMTRGVILDAIGSETADAVAEELHKVMLKQMAEEQGFSVTPRFSPGYGDWPVTVQKDLLELCSGELIGISVNESSLMIPRKSVSAVFGWVKKR